MNKHNLPEKVFTFTEEKALFSAPCHLLVAVSGGADSMALIHCLLHWAEPGLQITVVHIHHGLRGDTADRDAAFVERFCFEHDIPFVLRYADVAQYATTERLSLEDAGRRLRYTLFEQLRCEIGADYVLTAHTASDQVETVMMHIIRGCGTDGLIGIPAARDLIRRPLLCCDRADIEAYCAEQGIPYVIDETNTDTRFVRNRIRHEVLPLLRSINPSVDRALHRLSARAAEDTDYLQERVSELIQRAKLADGYDAPTIAAQPAPIRRRILRCLMTKLRISSIEESHILAMEQVSCSGQGSVSLPDAMIATVGQGILRFYPVISIADADSIFINSIPVSAEFGKAAFSLSVQTNTDLQNVHKLFSNAAVDYDKIHGKLCVRRRCEGDYIHPAGRHIGKSLKKLMNECHIPAHLRDIYPVLCDEEGIVMVPGLACDERVAPSTDTKHFLVWSANTELG